MHQPPEISSTEFAARFGHWSFQAQRSPIKVTNRKTGAVLGYFIAESYYQRIQSKKQSLPAVGYAWELPEPLAKQMKKPMKRRPELDHLMDE